MKCATCYRRKPLPNQTRCRPCRDENRERDRRLRNLRRRCKLCVSCGAKAMKGKKYCKPHLRYFALYARKRRRVLNPLIELRSYRPRGERNGNCTRCYRRDATPPHTNCDPCLEYMREYSKTHPKIRQAA